MRNREKLRDALETPSMQNIHTFPHRMRWLGKTMETAITRTRIRGGALLNAQVILDARDVTENHPLSRKQY